MTRAGWLVVLVAAAGCDGLPELEPPRFACEDDALLDDGAAPCGSGHWCVEGTCEPRLGCQEPGAGIPGCRRSAEVRPGDLVQVERCEAIATAQLSAVRCVGGTFEGSTPAETVTSTRPDDPAGCDCPSGLVCVTWLEGPGLDLRWLPGGGAAPGPEQAEARYCVRACSQEANCTAGHTCRPTTTGGADREARDTIATCYPDVIVPTSSTSTVVQPTEGACVHNGDCESGRVCQFRVQPVADHPVVPIGGPFWADRVALVGHCVDPLAISGRPANDPCSDGVECESGLCGPGGRCRQPCDPAAPERACNRRVCVVERFRRRVGDRAIDDDVSVCELL